MPDASTDPFDLERFVKAQAPVYDQVCEELRRGRKQSHWIWFIFPQLRGLGSSARANYYGIGSIEEARAYLVHPILGPHLDEVTRLVLAIPDRSLRDIFGIPDDAKFRSSMTLFSRAAQPGSLFEDALTTFCDGPDERTAALLKGANA